MNVIRPEFYVGRKVGKLTILGPSKRKYHVRCRCNCGTVIEAYVSNLRLKKTTSCGSHRNGTLSVSVNIVSGDSRHSLYSLWRGMINRCFNKRQPHYARYGGRGITVCSRWLTFRNFVSDMGLRPSKHHTLERLDNSKNYCPDNCRWETYKTQARNKRIARNVRLISFRGQTRSLTDWANQLEMLPITLMKRFQSGWSTLRALTTPVALTGPKRRTT